MAGEASSAATQGAEERSVSERPGAGRDRRRDSGNERLDRRDRRVVAGAARDHRRDDPEAQSQLLWVHLFVGMVLIGPVLLKMASTGYRFARYYTANPAIVARVLPRRRCACSPLSS